MSEANVELVRGVFDAARRRETAMVLALFFREWYEAWETQEDVFDELIDAGDHVISVGAQRGRGRASGVQVDRKIYGVWTIHDSKIARVAWFPTREEALEAAGLAE